MNHRKGATCHFQVVFYSERCKGCGVCVASCPKQCLKLSDALNSRGQNYPVQAKDTCIGCGICFYGCPEIGAIEVHHD